MKSWPVVRKPALPLLHPAALLATWFGAGLLPGTPGTWGSLVALPFAWIIAMSGGPWALAAAAIVVFLVGWWASDAYARACERDDPGDVVIDEVAAQWLVLLPAGTDIPLLLLGFLLFRIADILKPWPASWADRRLSGGIGIMLDDIFAAAYAGAVLYAVAFWLEGM